jgi:protein SCO1/2
MSRGVDTTVVRLRIVAPLLLLAVAGLPAAAQADPPLPAGLEGVGITQNLDAALPLDLRFADENGQPVALGDYFVEGRPVLLTLVYYECPMLCTLVLNGLVDALQQIDWTPGEEFEIVTVTIDPKEKPTLARMKKQQYIEDYGNPAAAPGWHFLTGEAPAIGALAETVGFGYRYLEDEDEFAHPAVVFIITPDGRISRYLFGVQHDPKTLRLSMVEAAAGRIGSPLDKFLLYCYRFDAKEGRYTPVAIRIMRVGGIGTMLILGAVLLTFWLREARQKRFA